MKTKILLITMYFAVLGCSQSDEEQTTTSAALSGAFPSVVIAQEGAVTDVQAWGRFLTYFEGQSVGVDDVLMGVAEIKAGQEIHPPHVHPEEEFLIVTEGIGEWHLNGKDFPAKAGDVLYARPGDIHGVKNTGDKVMKFVVWKWSPR